MTKIILIVMLACLTTPLARAEQGNVIFNNRVVSEGISAPIYDNVVGGTVLDGTAYRAQLYSGSIGTPETQLQPTGAIVDFRSGVAAGYVNVGLDGTRAIPGVAPGDIALVQIRAWTASAGTTYEQARTNFAAGSKIGRSNVLTITTPSSILYPPASLSGLQSFAIQGIAPPTPAITHAPASASLFWPGDDLTYLVQWPQDGSSYNLEYSSDLGANAQWQLVYPAPSFNGTNYSVRIAAQTVRGFFRLKLR